MFVAGVCQADPVIKLSPGMEGVGTQLSARYLEDAGYGYSLGQVQSEPLASAFAPLPDGRSNFGISSSDFWVRIDVQNSGNKPLSWFLEASYPQWDHVDFYRDGAKVLSGGEHVAFAMRAVATESNVLPLSTPADAGQRIWVHFSNDLPALAETQLRLWTPEAFYQHIAYRYMAIGAFVGIGIILLLYNLLIGYSTRMPEYIWYTLYLFAAVMTLLTLTGFGYRYLWPDAVWFTDFAPVLFVTSTLMLATQFTRSFLHTARESVVIDRLLQAVFVLGGLSLLCYMIGCRDYSLKVIFLCAVISVLYPLIGMWQYRKGSLDARFYVAGWCIWSLAMIVAVLRHLGLIPSDFVTSFSPSLGFSIEAVLLSFALADRINRLRDEKKALEVMHIDHLQQEQETLERVVSERTSELEHAMQRAELLAMTDVLTGVMNRRAFFACGEKELERAMRYKTTLAVVMIDLDGFKEINDRHGHAAGDAVLMAVGKALSGMIRNVDALGRIGGEEFATILPRTDLKTATDLAERLRRALEELAILVGELRIHVTSSFGVAAVDVENETLGEALKRADMALYRAKANGRNRVEQAAHAAQARTESADFDGVLKPEPST